MVKLFEDMLDLMRRDAASGVGDLDFHHARFREIGGYCHLSAGRGELDGIMNQIDQDLIQLVLVPFYQRKRPLVIHLKSDAFLSGQVFQILDDLHEQLRNRQGRDLECHPSGIDLGKV